MCKISHELVGTFESNLHKHNIGLIFKSAVEINRTNLRVCGGGHLFSFKIKTFTVVIIGSEYNTCLAGECIFCHVKCILFFREE